jgi:hypothetical protein
MSTPFCWRRSAVGVVVCACAVIMPSVCAHAADTVSSLSGYVYLDSNQNHLCDPQTDWAIAGAVVTLTKEGDSSFLVSVRANRFGFYSFDGPSSDLHTGLFPGVYDITLAPYTAIRGADTAGQFQNLETGLILTPTDLSDYGTTSSDGNSFRGIRVVPGMAAVDYNFGKAQYPLELVSKRMMLTTSVLPQHPDDPQDPSHTAPVIPSLPGTPLPTPEPGTVTILVIGAFGLAVAALLRHRKPSSHA